MKKNILLKTTFAAAALVAALGLTACHSHSNPLLTAKKAKAVKFLVAAQDYASTKTHLYYATDSVYVTCIKNPSHFNNPLNSAAPNPCANYLKAMSEYTSKAGGIKDVSVSDLQDSAVIKKLGNALSQAQTAG